MIYRDECGFIAEVAVVGETHSKKTTATTFLVIEIYAKPTGIPAEMIPMEGERFTAWKSHNCKYHGWTIEGI